METTNYTGQHILNHLGGMCRKVMALLSFLLLCITYSHAQVTVTGSNGANGSYTTLKLAFDAINAKTTQTGYNIQIAISASINDNNTAKLNAGNWTTLKIYPTSSVTISGDLAAPLIDLSGADHVSIDGRVNGSGTPKALTIVNRNTSNTDGTSTIRFINDATYNTIQYCVLKGAATTWYYTTGIIYFATGASSGNSNNLIDNNSLTGVSSTLKPQMGICSTGTSATVRNMNITISNNLFYDIFNTEVGFHCILLGSFNNNWTITENSFYETSTDTKAYLSGVVMMIIYSSGNSNGNNYTITNNYFGGNAPKAEGIWSQSFTDSWNISFINCTLTENSDQITIQGNVAKNISINAVDLSFSSIYLETASVISGTVSDNIVGSTTSAGNITLNASGQYANDLNIIPIEVYGGGGTPMVVRNNSVGGITVNNSSANLSTRFRGIYLRGLVTVSNNIVGSTTVPNSINISSAVTNKAQSLYGIYTNPYNFPNNAIVSNNTVVNLKATTPYASSITSGIGVYFSNAVTQSATVSSNYIYNINANNGSLCGILADYTSINGAASNTYIQNNVINLTNNTSACSTKGIDFTGKCNGSINFYYNTVYLGGTCTTGLLNSYGLFLEGTTSLSNILNNLLVNKRTNSGATGKHYAISAASAPTLINNNDYVINSASGGVTGYLSMDRATLADWQTATSQDVWSIDKDPNFTMAGGSNATDYIPKYKYLYGTRIAGITKDYNDSTRHFTPTMGAFEIELDLPVEVWKDGASQGGYVNLGTAFTDINAGTHTGDLDVKIKANTNETSSAVLNAGTSPANYSSIKIYPTTSGLSVSGTLSAAPLINLNDADNVTIDGRVNGNTGTTPDLTIVNKSASNSTIKFIGGALADTIRYCYIQGSASSTTGGVILFSTGSSSAGNNNNGIMYNNITNYGGNRPYNTIYSAGSSATIMNTGNTISNNQFYNFLNRGSSYGINLYSNNSDWTISGNSFYDNEAATFIPSVAGSSFNIIYVNSGNNYTITNNYIGGRATKCGGTAWTKTNAFDNPFYGINLTCGNTTASNVLGNTIQNISWSNSGAAAWYGINASGAVNVGASGAGNTVGSATVTGSITYSAGAANSSPFGIYVTPNGTSTTSYNTIGGISCSPTTVGNIQSVYGLCVSGGTGAITVNGNTIANIRGSSTSTSSNIAGIAYAGGTTASTVSGNFINSITAGSGSNLYGIYKTMGKVTMANNIITLGNNTSNTLYGIYEAGAGSNNTTLYFNTVYLGGAPSTCALASYALYSAGTATRIFQNNLLVNARSNAGATGVHYAAYLVNTTLTLDYNDYWVSGSGRQLGYAGGAKSALPLVTGKDANSKNVDPSFVSAGSTAAINYAPQTSGINGTSATGIATDYFGIITRSNYTMGAIEQVLATVTTQAVSSIGATTATGNGNITSLGVPNPTAYGVCWSSLTYLPTTADSKVDNGAASATGAFTAAITGLTPGTLYYVRAYATNAAGTSYGDVVAFTSYIAPAVTTQAVSSITTTSATGNGNITTLGVPNPTAYGVCWSSTNSTPSTTDSMVDNGSASATGAFTAAITGLTSGTLYYVRAYATNAAGTSYGVVVTFTSYIAPTVTTQAVSGITTTTATGNGNITSLGVPNPIAYGVCWSSTNATPTTSDPKVDKGSVSATGAFTAAITGLTSGTLYYVRAYATNAAGTSYGAVVTFNSYIAPTVTTQAVSSIGATTATGNGTITSLGTPNPTAYGVCWSSTNTTPTTSDSKVDNGAASATGTFTVAITGLATQKLYYVRAYATNSAGTAYGDVVTFDNFNYWKGTVSNDWNTPANWTLNSILVPGDDLYFAASPFNHCVMDQNRIIGSLHNDQSTYRLVTNGHNLTINGSFNQTNGAQVDASASGSTITFGGTSAQTIPAGTFYNNQVVNVAVNNSSNVTLYGNLSLSGSLTTTSGALDADSQSPSVTLNSSTAQTIESNTWLNNRIYNLTVANTVGVTDYALFTVSNNLTLNTGSIFTINAAKTLSVNGTLTNNAGASGLVIASNAYGTGSLVHSTDNVPSTVNRYIDGAASAWHFLSSPVTGQAIHGTGWTPAGTYGDGTGYDMYVWYEPASCWIYNLNTTVAPTWTTAHPSANYVAGRGYLYAVQAATPTKQFVGNLNNGTVNYGLSTSATGSYKGFNLVGNPYPSSIDWKIDGGYSRSLLEQTGGGYNIWIWSATAGNYGVYNSAFAGDAGTNNVTRYIPPMEGFFVKAASAGTFSFYNACRVHNEASNWLKVKSTTMNDNLMKITVNSDEINGQDEVMLYFGCQEMENGATKIFNTTYESGINKSKAPNLFLPCEKENYSIRYFSDTKENSIIPLNIKVLKNAGYALHFSVPDTMQNAVLEDKLTGQINRIVNGGSYSFKASTTDQVSRFNIRFGSVDGNEILPVLIYRNGDDLIIDATAMKGNYQIKMVDLTGRNYFTKYEHGGTKNIIPVKIRQMYIITLTTQEKRSEYKIIF